MGDNTMHAATTTFKTVLETAGIIGITTVILYFSMIGIAADMMDDYIPGVIITGAIPDVSQVNYILAFYSAVVFGGLVISARYLSDDVDVAMRAWLLGMALTFAVAVIGLAGYPGLFVSADRWLLVPSLFTTLVLRDPGMFMVIEASCIAVLYLVLSMKKELS